MQMSCLYASDFYFQNFYKNNVWETSNDTYSLLVGVQTSFDLFFTPISTSKKMFFFRARAEKGIAWHADASRVVLRN